MIEVCAAAAEDMKTMAQIMVRSFESGFSHIISRETMVRCANEENCKNMLAAIYAGGKMRFLAGYLDGVLCGELIWGEGEGEGTAEIVAIHSLPESWGSGLGKAMLQRALADMADEGKNIVYLWAFRENLRGRRFYEKQGLRLDGAERISEFDDAAEVRYFINLHR